MGEGQPFPKGVQVETHPLEPQKIELGSFRPGRSISLAPPFMTWGVWDYTAMSGSNYPASGGHFTSIPGHRYLVVLRAEDGLGVESLTLDGSGMFDAYSDPDADHNTHHAPEPLPASIPHQEFENPQGQNAPTVQDLVVIMDPDIGAWEYDRLSCGFHIWGTTGPLEYFAADGTMTFSGTSSDRIGRRTTASLTTSR